MAPALYRRDGEKLARRRRENARHPQSRASLPIASRRWRKWRCRPARASTSTAASTYAISPASTTATQGMDVIESGRPPRADGLDLSRLARLNRRCVQHDRRCCDTLGAIAHQTRPGHRSGRRSAVPTGDAHGTALYRFRRRRDRRSSSLIVLIVLFVRRQDGAAGLSTTRSSASGATRARSSPASTSSCRSSTASAPR